MKSPAQGFMGSDLRFRGLSLASEPEEVLEVRIAGVRRAARSLCDDPGRQRHCGWGGKAG